MADLPAPPITIKRITPLQTLPLRELVLLQPNAPPSQMLLPSDDSGYHFGAFLLTADINTNETETKSLVSVISLFLEPIPGESDQTHPGAARFRKFATHPSYRSLGIGSQLLDYIIQFARGELGVEWVWCDARTGTKEWYKRRGMVEFGEVFWKGSVEYVGMKVMVG